MSGIVQNLFTLVVFFGILVTTFVFNFFSSLFSKRGKNFENQVIMITGSGNGLGRSLALKFAKIGAKIALVDVDEKSNRETLEMIGGDSSKAYFCDVSKNEQVRKLATAIADDFGNVDVLISNAAILACHKITQGSEDDIQRVVDVNLLSNFWIVREFLRLVQRNQGHFVFVNSESAIHGLGLASSYAASKAGLLGLAYSLQSELRRNRETKGIKITSVHPRFFASHSSMKKAVETGWMDVESVADKIIDGIRKELFTFCVPGDFLLSTLFRQLPVGVYHFLLDKYFFAGIKSETRPVFFTGQVAGVSSHAEKSP